MAYTNGAPPIMSADRRQAVDACIELLVELAGTFPGELEERSIHTVVQQALGQMAQDGDGATDGRTMLEDSLRTNANLLAPDSPEAAEVLMRAYTVTTAKQ